MEDLNQLKIVLVKKKRTSKWLAEQLGVNQTTVSKSTRFTNIETYNRTVRSEHSRLNKLLVK